MLAEGRVQNRLQHLQQCLLDQPIRHRRDAKLALTSLRFRDRYSPYRTRPVRPLLQLLTNRGPRRYQVSGGLIYIQTVYTSSSFVCPYPLKRPLQVLSRQHRFQQRRPYVPGFMSRAASFVTHRYTRSFTVRYSRLPRLHGHLTQCLPHRHDAEHSFSFGPSSLASALPAYPVTNMASADFSLRLDTVALSSMRRDLPR